MTKRKTELELARERAEGRSPSEETRLKLSRKMKDVARTERFRAQVRLVQSRIKRAMLPNYLKRKGL